MSGSPCKGCPDRMLLCHGACSRYQDWKKQCEERNAAVYAEKGLYRPLNPQAKKSWLAKIRRSK